MYFQSELCCVTLWTSQYATVICAHLLTEGEGLSLPLASEDELVFVAAEELALLSTLHEEDMSALLGREVFMRTRRSSVDTLYGIVDSSGSDLRRSSEHWK